MPDRPILVIGYGNELRCDDGVGPQVAAAVAAWNNPSLQVIGCHQLTPELAENIASASAVIFVDAIPAAADAPVEILEIQPSAQGTLTPHRGDPASLLGLTQVLFGRSPPAWCVAVPAVEFALGDHFSPTAARGLREAVAAIRKLCEGLRPPAQPESG